MPTIKTVTRPRPDSSGALPLYLRITHNGKPRYISLGHKVKPRHFNSGAGRLRKSAPNHAKINAYLAAGETDAQRVVADLLAAGESLTASRIKAELENVLQHKGGKKRKKKSETTGDFLGYCDRLVAGYLDRGQIATGRAYRVAVRKLRDWARHQGRSALPFDVITPALCRSFHTYVSAPVPVGLGLKLNTVHKNMSALKTMYKQAMTDGVIPYGRNPFGTVRLKKEAGTKDKASIAEIRQLATVPLTGLMADVRDWFMFAFYAGGMRFSDVATLKRKHITTSGGDWRVSYKMKKTGEGVFGVLLLPDAIEILQRFGVEEKAASDWAFPILSGYDVSTPTKLHSVISSRNVLANKYLRKIGKAAGIKTRLTFHIARHSVAGYLLEQGKDIYTIQQVLGHASVRITEQYIAGFRSPNVDDAMRDLRL